MLSVERVKHLLKDPSLSDKEAEEIRDEVYALARIIVEHWRSKRAAADDHSKAEGAERQVDRYN
jgi:hypothetical protein